MYFSLDRIEEEWAVLVDDDGNSVDVLLTDLPEGACPGKVYRNEAHTYVEDPAEEKARRERIQALQNRLRRK